MLSQLAAWAAGLVIAAGGSFAAASLAVDGPVHRVSVPGVVSDGPLPTPTPTPVPTYPQGLAHCYQPRPADTGGWQYFPAGPKSVLQMCQVIGWYGYPGFPALGVLAHDSPEVMFPQLKAQVDAYDAVNGPRGVIPAFHMIAAIAHADPGEDGDYLGWMPDSLIREWIALADKYNAIVILDVQMGTSTVDKEIGRVLPYLQNPRVHLAVDPEWAMPDGVPPGTIIGGMDAWEINRAQELMSNYIAEHHLLNRMLLVHQFVPQMIRDKEQLTTYPGVDLVINTDGFGYPQQKIDNYDRYIVAEGAPFGGMKLFYRRDIGLMTPGEVSALVPQPDFISYE